ncbi:MAG TPA: hypothetical protein ENH12_04715 [Proteobacteria bacterium]|nr:hypothetical protein [Pseudomonadota bacterium]
MLGVHIIGPDASNLISEASALLYLGARIDDLAGMIHPHPTLSEGFGFLARQMMARAVRRPEK